MVKIGDCRNESSLFLQGREFGADKWCYKVFGTMKIISR